MNVFISIGCGILVFLGMGLFMNYVVKEPKGEDGGAVILYSILSATAVALITYGI